MDYFEHKRVLVTGASGFIGSNLVHRLVQKGAQTGVLVRDSSDLWRLAEIKKDVGIFKASLEDQPAVDLAFKEVQPELVFHCAAYGVDPRQTDYDLAVKANIIGTMNILDAAGGTGCEKIINTGTCMEYGEKQQIIRENCEPEPVSIYGSTKAAATIIARQIAFEKGINLITLRPFGVFGEREGSHKFFPHLILSILAGREVKLSPCEQYRDYCYIDNIIDGFLLAAQAHNVKNTILNIGSGVIHQLKTYVDLVYQLMEIDGKPLYGAVPYRKNEMWKQQPEVSKIKRLLHWNPRISLEEGIKRTIAWYRQNQYQYSM